MSVPSYCLRYDAVWSVRTDASHSGTWTGAQRCLFNNDDRYPVSDQAKASDYNNERQWFSSHSSSSLRHDVALVVLVALFVVYNVSPDKH